MTASSTFSKTMLKSEDGRVTRTSSLKRIVNNKVMATECVNLRSDQIVKKKLQLKEQNNGFEIIIRKYKAY